MEPYPKHAEAQQRHTQGHDHSPDGHTEKATVAGRWQPIMASEPAGIEPAEPHATTDIACAGHTEHHPFRAEPQEAYRRGKELWSYEGEALLGDEFRDERCAKREATDGGDRDQRQSGA
jgi:hypothetical protein